MTTKEIKEKLQGHPIEELLVCNKSFIEAIANYTKSFSSDIDDAIRYVCEDHMVGFQYCCGMGEVEFLTLPWDEKKLIERLTIAAHILPFAGYILTNAYADEDSPTIENGKGEAVLNKLCKPQYMGVNRNTNRHIFLWAIPKETIISYYEKHFKEENKKRLKQVPTTAKKSPSKSSKLKK